MTLPRLDMTLPRLDMNMTLLDYFAAAAMQGMIATGHACGSDRDGLAEQAYKMAKAMMAQRRSY